ncbi:MAG: hypothetical protein IPJ65_23990 [Archangiaceae bacterium]|nr:hypothetical protein [Archangiaceae bacterium]
MMRPSLTLLALMAAGCVGEAEFQPGSMPARPGQPDGDGPVQVGTFQGLSKGLPAAKLGGTAQYDGALFAVASEGLYRLANGTSTWEPVELGVKATSVTRIDTSVWVTWADGAAGGLFRLALGDDAFAKVEGAPSAPSYAVIKKGSELLLATSSGLLVSQDRGASWSVRSTAALFQKAVSALVASSAATRMFALQDGKLWYSDDAGSSWSAGLVGGEVAAVGAEGAYALLQTSAGTLRSDNYGNTFHAIDLGAKAQAFAASGKRAFAGTMNGMRVSDDGGATWRDASAGLPAGAPVMQLFVAGAALVASTGEAVYVASVQ